ncbi:mycofactocin biosynthesis peptidyl-dipeptidase MftE [Nocardioides sp. BYT-33-1]|uniref:mycofactocin biosynthesis peptidyl-dipeptidase MftE n=1 Tax=Nocardioides sp. BYT-33-1 TaxID=3416952 RepID=UPI003F535FD6
MEIALASTPSPRVPDQATLLVPVGSTEQHGPHLPLDTDTEIAVAVAEQAAKLLRRRRINVVVAPPIAYGSSGEHQDFPGTISIGTEVLRAVLVEVVRSACTWARRVVLVNGHGGNIAAVRSAVAQTRAEGRDVSWVPCSHPASDLHAGHTETSLMLHLKPWEVRQERAELGNTAPLDVLYDDMRRDGVKAVSPNGVLGDPRQADADAGHEIFDQMAWNVVRNVIPWPIAAS